MMRLRLKPKDSQQKATKSQSPVIEAKAKLPTPKKLAPLARDQRQLRYLSQSVRLEEGVSPKIVQRTMLVISLAVIFFVAWASVTTVDEIARSEGEIIARGFNRVVQHPDGGRIAEIFKFEGDFVEEGEPILRLSEHSIERDIAAAKVRQLDLSLDMIRLEALHDEVEPDYGEYLITEPKEVEDEMAMFNAYNEARNRERQLIQDQINQRQQNLRLQQQQLQIAKNNLAIAVDMYNRRQFLRDERVLPESRFLEIKQRRNELEGEVKNIENQIALSRLAIQEQQTRLGSLDAKYRDDLLQEMDNVEVELEQLNEQIAKLERQRERLTIIAPASGYIKGSTAHTVGGVIQPASTVMEIIPSNSELIALVKIPAQHIGHVNTGDPVRVKFATFDYARYGGVMGTLEYISASSFLDQNNGSTHYQGRVALESLHVGGNPRYHVMAGMAVTADIIAERKTILQYLLKPVRDSLRTAFTER